MRWIAPLAVILAACGGGSGGTPSSAPDALPPIPEAKAPRREPPQHTVGGFKLILPPLTLAPGEERSPCYVAPLVVEGPSRLVGGGRLQVGKGMHHGNITTRPRKTTGTGVQPCPKDSSTLLGGEGSDVLAGGSVLFGSSTQMSGEEWQTFPDGMAFRVKEGFEIVARMHYLNTTTAPLTIAPRYEWFTVDESKVKTELGPFLWVYKGFEIPPRSKLTVTAECIVPTPMHVVTLMPHMHKLGTAFTAGWYGGPLEGKNFLESKGYDPEKGLIAQFEPAVDLSLGEGVRFSCSWENTFDKKIVEGIGDNEMCMAFGYGYPADKVYTLMGNYGGVCPAITPK